MMDSATTTQDELRDAIERFMLGLATFADVMKAHKKALAVAVLTSREFDEIVRRILRKPPAHYNPAPRFGLR